MTFPVVFHLFGLNLPAHMVLQTLGYAVGFRLYLRLRKATHDDFSDETRLSVFIAAVVGAAIGSKLLAFAEHPQLWRPALTRPVLLISAQSLLGALLGGTLFVETAKRLRGITRSTGDIYVFPLLAGMIIGRIGCLLTGITDGTWGDATRLPLGFDAGDGIVRHPTPLYEILFLLALSGLFLWLRSKPMREGDRFKLFMLAYCAWRFVIEFLKPVTTYAINNRLNIVQNIATDHALAAAPGLSVLQMAAVVALLCYAYGRFGGRPWRRATTSSSS
jgi:prolipoprotein diacylglyceryltransferase